MVDVRVQSLADALGAPVPAGAILIAQVFEGHSPATRVAADDVTFPVSIRLDLTGVEGQTFALYTLPPNLYWRIVITVPPYNVTRNVVLPAGAGPFDFADLVDVDPATALPDPGTALADAFIAELEAIRDATIAIAVDDFSVSQQVESGPLTGAALDAAYAQHDGLTSADIQAALTAANGVDDTTVRLAPGHIYEVSNTWIVGAHTTLEGNGAIVVAANGLDDDVITNRDHVNGDPFITIRDLIVDGNKANQGDVLPSPDHIYVDDTINGINLVRCQNGSLENVLAKNVKGTGIRVSGEGTYTRPFALNNVRGVDNDWDGVLITDAMRGVQYEGVLGYRNGRHGVVIDHSEANTSNVWARENGAWGIFVRNVQACNLYGLHATVNGEHGIFVLGLLYSRGGGWYAANNGQADVGGLGALGYSDVYFTGQTTIPGYGVTDYTNIDGITAGYNSTTLTTGGGNRQAYCVYIADEIAERGLKLTNVHPLKSGQVDTIRVPAGPTQLLVEALFEDPNRKTLLAGSHYIRSGGYLGFQGAPSGSLPDAVEAGAGAQTWDTTLGRPVYSNGNEWRSGFPRKVTAVSTDTDLVVTDDVVSVSTGGITVTLPDPGSILIGTEITIKNRAGTGITVATYGAGKTIEGNATRPIAAYGVMRCIVLGSNWWLL